MCIYTYTHNFEKTHMYIYIEELPLKGSWFKYEKFKKSVFSEGEDRNKSLILYHDQIHTVCTNH